MPHITQNGTATNRPRTRRRSASGRSAAAAAGRPEEHPLFPTSVEDTIPLSQATTTVGRVTKTATAPVGEPMTGARLASLLRGGMGITQGRPGSVPPVQNPAVASGSQADPRASLFSSEPGAVFTGSELSSLVGEAVTPPHP